MQENTTYDDLFLKLNIAMDKLSELQKQIVQMKLTGKDYSEMSEELGVTHSQIHKNIKKAYDKIRHYVRKNETLMLILSPLFSLLHH
uniref:sigma factor-like helix-turn-helix DNA-binding protein n=1 Tax=Butyricimonas virosa TaxID=544645 RepID=UPI004027BD0F